MDLDKLRSSDRECIEKLVDTLVRSESRIQYLQEQILDLKSETYKDKELAAMRESYKQMEADYYRGFPISEKERERIKKWIANHEEEHRGGHGACGGKYNYIFTPTGIGTFGCVKCSCGKEFVFQDLS